jgi:hypothetical protein
MSAMLDQSTQLIQILGQTLESGSLAYLVSVNGDHPEPMSKSVLTELVRPPQYLSWKWDEVTRSNSRPVIETVERGMFKFLDDDSRLGRRSVRVK